jgi:hypothetical protein
VDFKSDCIEAAFDQFFHSLHSGGVFWCRRE